MNAEYVDVDERKIVRSFICIESADISFQAIMHIMPQTSMNIIIYQQTHTCGRTTHILMRCHAKQTRTTYTLKAIHFSKLRRLRDGVVAQAFYCCYSYFTRFFFCVCVSSLSSLVTQTAASQFTTVYLQSRIDLAQTRTHTHTPNICSSMERETFFSLHHSSSILLRAQSTQYLVCIADSINAVIFAFRAKKIFFF